MRVTSGGGRSNATSNQLFWLFKLTRRRYDDKPITMQQASDIIGRAIEIRKRGKGNASGQMLRELEELVRVHYPDWCADELNLDYIPTQRKTSAKQEPKRKAEPETPMPETPDMPDLPTGDDPYAQLPQEQQDKLKEIERILKDRQAKNTADAKTTPTEEKTEPPKPTPKPKYDNLPAEFVVPPLFDHMVTLAKNRINFMLCGPAGCGKTYMANMVAKAINQECYDCTLSGGVRYSQVFGSTNLKNGDSEWTPSDLLKAVQRPGVVVINEILGGDADVLIGFNSLTEPGQRFINTPAGRLEVHPECRFIATANNKGRSQSRSYIAAQVQDGSILDRFGVKLDVDYDATVEKKLAESLIDASTADKILKLLANLRTALKTAEINFDPSTRRLLLCCQQIKAGIVPSVAFETTFLTSLSHAERKTINM